MVRLGGDTKAIQVRHHNNGDIDTYLRSDVHDTDLHAATAENFIRSTAGGARSSCTSRPTHPTPPPTPPRNTQVCSPARLCPGQALSTRRTYRTNQRGSEATSTNLGKISGLTNSYRKRLRALQSVDEMVLVLVHTLQDTGELSNTFIVFTSDNGVYLVSTGSRPRPRLQRGARIPLLIRGPGVPQGVAVPDGAEQRLRPHPRLVGRRTRPISWTDVRSSPLTSALRLLEERFLVEHRRSPEEYANVRTIPNTQRSDGRYNYGVRNRREGALRLNADPAELPNIYNSASQTLISNLQTRLVALKSCARADTSATSCKTAEDGQ